MKYSQDGNENINIIIAELLWTLVVHLLVFVFPLNIQLCILEIILENPIQTVQTKYS